MIRLGESRLALAGRHGEHDARRPHVIRGARSGFRLGEGKLEDSLMVALLDTHCGLYMAQTSDNLARQHGITREAHGRLRAAQPEGGRGAPRERGVFKEEIVAGGRRRRAARPCASRRTTTCGPETTLEGLAALQARLRQGRAS